MEFLNETFWIKGSAALDWKNKRYVIKNKRYIMKNAKPLLKPLLKTQGKKTKNGKQVYMITTDNKTFALLGCYVTWIGS